MADSTMAPPPPAAAPAPSAALHAMLQEPAKPVFKTLSILIPVYNEERYLAAVVKRVVDQPLPGGLTREIIMVNDASRDKTWDIMQQIPALFPAVPFKLFNKTKNEGKGAALRDAWAMATGDLLIVQDADFEYDPADYPKLLAPIEDGSADVVYGSRFIGWPRRALNYWHQVGNRVLTLASNVLTNINLTDMETCYKVFRREIIQAMPLESTRFGFEPEITVKLARGRWRIYEVPVSYHGRSYGEGKKIGWKDGVEAFWVLFHYAWFDRTPVPMRQEQQAEVHAPLVTSLPAFPDQTA